MSCQSVNWLIALSVIIAVKAHQYVVTQMEQEDSPVHAISASDLRFKIDTAKLTVVKNVTDTNFDLDVLMVSDHCYKCAYYTIASVEKSEPNKTFLIDTKWSLKLLLKTASTNCSVRYHFGERGEYILEYRLSNKTCVLEMPKIVTKPYMSSLPILWVFLMYFGLALLYTFGRWLYDRKKIDDQALITNDLGNPVAQDESTDADHLENSAAKVAVTTKRERIKSIDCFRGLSIIIMIFVNYKGGYYWFFRHSSWNGLTVADLVFPWFMFIMGINITLSINSLRKNNVPLKEIILKLIKRTIILFCLGLFIINQTTSWNTLRIPGVLQRFAFAYLFAFSIQLAFHKLPEDLETRYNRHSGGFSWMYRFRDICPYWPQWIIVFVLETIWLLVTFLLHVPDCPSGYLGPGGLADDGKYMNVTCVGGAAGYIDRWLFSEKHMYGHPTCKPVYYPTTKGEVPYDPEGVLGAINGCIIVFLGCQVGKIFLYYKSPKERCIRWMAWCLILGIISIVLTKASTNEGWIPVNKNLWTTSFVTTLSCMAFFLMTVFYLLVDVWKVFSGSPMDFVGMNSILLYVGHETFASYVPFTWGLDDYSTHLEWLFMNVLAVNIWMIIAYISYRKKFFLKI